MVLDWLLKVVLVGGLVAVIAVDLGAITVNRIGLASTADEIVAEMRTSLASGAVDRFDIPAMRSEAATLAAQAGAKLVYATLSPSGVLKVRLRRTATTLVVGRIDALRGYIRATANARATT